MNENNHQEYQNNNETPKPIKNAKKPLSPEEIKKRRLKRKIKLIAILTAIALAFILVITGIIALIVSLVNDEADSTEESYYTSETISIESIFGGIFGELSKEESDSIINSSSEETFEETTIEENISQESSEPVVEDNWYLILINEKNPINDDFQFPKKEMENELTSDGDAVIVDERIIPYLAQMLEDARNDGLTPVITSAYRTMEHQQRIMDDYISDYLYWGYSQEDAEAEAKKWVAIPGTSEHHSGLAVDISSVNSSIQDPYYIWSWLEDNAHKYGFILRYTEENQEITGVNPEPWHFRFVGIEDATEIYNNGLTLEEYLENK